MKAETVYFQLILATPLHIGCGEVYEPMGFVIDQEARELISFSPSDFLGRLSSNELEKFSAICSQGTVESIQKLYTFMRLHRDLAQGARVAVSDDFYSHYDDVLNKPRQKFRCELTDFSINRTFFNPIENTPIIPGSSIKGAIRTAVLNAREKKNPQPVKDFSKTPIWSLGKETAGESSQLQRNHLGGSFATDPFRLIKVSDFIPAGDVKRKVNYAVAFGKKDAAVKQHQMQETIEPGSRFWGSITILPAPKTIRKPVTPAEIINAMQTFYGAEKKREDRELQTINVQPAVLGGSQGVSLRLGRHSGAECVTVKGHRHIKITPPAVKPPKFSKRGATTIWLASPRRKPTTMSGLQPMGWVQLAPLSANELKTLHDQQKQMRIEKEQQRQKEQEEFARQQESRLRQAWKVEELRRKQEQEAELKMVRLEDQHRRWLEMIEEEQDVAIVRGDEIAKVQAPDKDPVRDIWHKLENAELEYRKNLAQAFCQLWQSQPNFWRKKQCSPGQWDKIERVVAILGIPHDDIQRLSAVEEELAGKIQALTDWGQYRNQEVDFNDLTISTAEFLVQKFTEWGCKNKKAKKDKKEAWKQLQSHLKQLRGK